MRWNDEKVILANPDILSESHVLPEIHGRNSQLKEIAICLRPLTEGYTLMHVWLYGKPGVGKTATARWSLRKFENEAGIKGVYVNCWENQTFLLWLYYYRLAEGKSQAFKHALLIEEAHNFFLRRLVGQSIYDLMLRQMRDLGEALILFDQNPSLLSIPALGNTGITICLNLKHRDDLEAAGKALTLPQDSWEYIGRLPVGYGIVKVQDRWKSPFLVYFPCFPVSSSVIPSQAERNHIRGSSHQQSMENPALP